MISIQSSDNGKCTVILTQKKKEKEEKNTSNYAIILEKCYSVISFDIERATLHRSQISLHTIICVAILYSTCTYLFDIT